MSPDRTPGDGGTAAPVSRLQEATGRLSGLTSADDLYRATVDAAAVLFPLHFGTIALLDDAGDRLLPVAATGDTSVPVRSVSADEGLVGEALATGSAVRVDGPERDDLATTAADSFDAALAVPFGGDGVFQALARDYAFDAGDAALLTQLLSYAAEIRERIRTKERLRERESALVAERDRLAALFDNVPEPVLRYEYVDGEPLVRNVNPEFESVFGYDADTVAGENVDEYIVPDDLRDEAAGLNDRLQAGESVSEVSRRMTADGLRDFVVQCVPAALDRHNREGFGIYVDITDQKRRERELERQNQHLEALATAISHDMRNPLQVAIAFLDRARESGDAAAFERIEAAHDRMNRLIDAVIALARQGEVIGEREDVDLGPLARQTWDTVVTGDAALTTSCNAAVIRADSARLGELLENLFVNAVEHGSSRDRDATDPRESGDADVDATVRVGLLRDPPTGGEAPGDSPPVGFYVEDDGVGIPESVREQALEPGFTTAGDGTGLGLGIVDRIAQAHGWEIQITESDAGGARIEFRDVTFRSRD